MWKWDGYLSDAAKQALIKGATLKFKVVNIGGVDYELLEGSYLEQDGTLKVFSAKMEMRKKGYPFNGRSSYMNAEHFESYLCEVKTHV